MKLEVHEILAEVKKRYKKDEKVEYLKKFNDDWALKDVLRGTFDDSIQWNLPEGSPPYTPNKPESVPSTLARQHLNFKYFVKGLNSSESLSSMKRETMFVQLLESVHPEDAKILLHMKNKKTPVRGLTKNVVQEAFPGLIKE